ncbi:unnamed protein product [Lampetra planeri]
MSDQTLPWCAGTYNPEVTASIAISRRGSFINGCDVSLRRITAFRSSSGVDRLFIPRCAGLVPSEGTAAITNAAREMKGLELSRLLVWLVFSGLTAARGTDRLGLTFRETV